MNRNELFSPVKLWLVFYETCGIFLRMRKSLSLFLAILVCTVHAFAQMGGGAGGGGGFDNGMEKLFAANPVFAASMKTQMTGPNGPMTVTAKMYFDHENSRTDMNMTDVQGSSLPQSAVVQMQSMGMDKIIMITPASKKTVYMIYPKIHCYAGVPMPAQDPAAKNFNVQITKLGTETVDGHPCVKNQVVVTNSTQSQEFTVWNATDLNNFPIQIQQNQQGISATITFQNITLGGLNKSLFVPPADYTHYDSMQSLMEAVVMKNAPGAGAPAPSVSPSPNQ